MRLSNVMASAVVSSGYAILISSIVVLINALLPDKSLIGVLFSLLFVISAFIGIGTLSSVEDK